MAVVVIAEAGVNHNGDVCIAKEMVIEAKKAGADYIKFQTFQPQKLVSRYAQKAEYQKENTSENESQLEMLEKLTLTKEEFVELQELCKKMEIGFLSTPFDTESIDMLDKMEMPIWKIPSGEITNLPYLEKIARTHKPIILSTGMCYMQEIKEAIKILRKNGASQITVLHCNTEYPTPMKDVNLNAMIEIKKECDISVGYSDHTLGIEVPIAAVALGAEVIEKHFTLDKEMKGPDHHASLEPKELGDMIRAIRNIEVALGTKTKKPSESEIKNIQIARKSIVASKKICKGEVFKEDNLSIKRPGIGLSPMEWYNVMGKVALRDYLEDEPIDEVR